MSDVIEIIKERRTVEQFLTKPVSWDKISKILDAARHAPSSGNIQNWKFVVVQDSDKKHTLAQHCHEQYEITAASTLVIVCAEPEKAERYYGLRGSKLYSIQNCAAAIQNMLIEAQSLGLATRWIGAFDEDEVKGAFNIPPEVRPQAVIAIGHSKVIPKKPSKYPLESLVYLDRWRNKIKDMDKEMSDYSNVLSRNVKGWTEQAKDVAKKVGVATGPAKKTLIEKMKAKLSKKSKKSSKKKTQKSENSNEEKKDPKGDVGPEKDEHSLSFDEMY
jgi:nitroreductase